ncbi:MAG: hypothetical protein UZ17_ACD001001293 [Acidobacteria bacterium OLB17]|nr:MAG: hypothetical protein UZ17_ACD001001293 [Acidobacteria bacterium OLB17]
MRENNRLSRIEHFDRVFSFLQPDAERLSKKLDRLDLVAAAGEFLDPFQVPRLFEQPARKRFGMFFLMD